MIEFDGVSKHYPEGNSSLEDIHLSIGEREFVSIVGHSGAGKTTLLKLILAQETPSAGTVRYQGETIHDKPLSHVLKVRRSIGTVFQDVRLFPNKTAFENVAFAMEAAGFSDEAIANDVPQALELVGLSDKADRFPHQLSGGEQQRLAIARAIITQPQVLIADEPTGNLDPDATRDIVNIFKHINELGTTIILATHSAQIVEEAPARVIELREGQIVRDDKQEASSRTHEPKEAPHDQSN